MGLIILFSVIYKSKEFSLEMDHLDSVHDLKQQVFKKTGLSPCKQLIECWHYDPPNDSCTLMKCCLTTECNYLIVRNVEDGGEDVTQVLEVLAEDIENVALEMTDHFLEKPSDAKSAEENSRASEIASILRFVQYFSLKFRNTGIRFHISSLEDAVNQICTSNLPTGKILLLYFHTEGTTFSGIFCKQLTDPAIQAILNNKYILLCWDLETESSNKALICALHKYDALHNFEHFVESKTCSALIIVPVGNQIAVGTVMKGEISENGFLTTLEAGEQLPFNENVTKSAEENLKGTEIECIGKFVEYFSRKFGNTGIPFYISSLEDAVNQICTCNSPKGKILLYFHKEGTKFSDVFCKQLMGPDIQAILNDNYILLCWDLETESSNKALICALHKYDALHNFEHFVESKTCSALIIVPVGNQIAVGRVMKGEISEKNFLTTLKTGTETECIEKFVEYFSRKFGNTGIPFHISPLEDTVNTMCSSDLVTGQALLLYLHKGGTQFSDMFCKYLTNPQIQALINNYYILLCWDLETDSYNEALIRALHNYDALHNLEHFVEFKTCSAVIIAPVGNSISVLRVMRDHVSENHFLTTLQISVRQLSFEENNRETTDNTFGSKAYQQLMLDMLGDRDYDNFDFNEHSYIRDKVGYALYGPPKSESGYDTKQESAIEKLVNVITKQNNLIAKWKDRVIMSVIYVCMEPLPEEKRKRAKKYRDYNPDLDLIPTPVFVLRKCKGSKNPCRVFIDDSQRVYKSWKGYLEDNKLGKCEMAFPKNGRYEADEKGNVMLGRQLSPSCSIAASVLKTADVASAVGGIASGGVLVAATAITAVAVAPAVVVTAGIAGAVTGAYAIGRSIQSLVDRGKHCEDLNFWNSSEARGAYLTIVAGALGFVGAGANAAVSRLIAEGSHIGKGASAAVNTLNVVNLGASGAGLANASYDVVRQWVCENEKPSALTLLQLSSSILFFGHAVYNFRTVNTIIEETQAKTLLEYQDSLRSNRHRKTFNKMMKETIRQNKGNLQKGRAEVISTIKNIQNKDEVFAALTRSNKNMNKHNVKFAANNGKITLNGITIDIAKFTSMEKNEVITFLKTLPSAPKASISDVTNMNSYLQNAFKGIKGVKIGELALSFVKMFANTDQIIKEKIITALAQLIRFLVGNPTDYLTILDRIFPQHDKYFRLLRVVNGYFQSLVNTLEEKYKKWLETKDPSYKEPYFVRLAQDFAPRATQLFDIATKIYFVGTNLTQVGLERLLDYFYTWFSREVYMYEESQERKSMRKSHSKVPAPKRHCKVCGGYYYSRDESLQNVRMVYDFSYGNPDKKLA